MSALLETVIPVALLVGFGMAIIAVVIFWKTVFKKKPEETKDKD